VLVGADGPMSTVRRQIGIPLPSKEDIHIGLQYTIEGPAFEEEMFLKFDPRFAPRGYCWEFPIEEGIRVGNGVPITIGNPKQYLDKLVNEYLGWEEDIVEKSGGLVDTSLPTQCQKGNVALVGAAAGFTNPLTGGGIINAIKSGRLLGKLIAEDSLHMYEKKWRQEFMDWLTIRYKLKKQVYQLSADQLDKVIQLLNQYEIESLDPTEELKGFIKFLLMNDPKLVVDFFLKWLM